MSAQALSNMIAAHVARVYPDPMTDDMLTSYNTALSHSFVSFNRPAPAVLKAAGLTAEEAL